MFTSRLWGRRSRSASTANTLVRVLGVGAFGLVTVGVGSGAQSATEPPATEPASSETASTETGSGSVPASDADLETVRAAAEEEGRVVVYMSIVLEEQIRAAWAEAYPDIDIEILRATSGDLLPRIEQERETGASGADVYIAGATNQWHVENSDELLDPVGTVIADHWSDRGDLVFDGGRYVTIAVNPFGIGYNTDVLDEVGAQPIAEWTDILQPELQGIVGITSPDQSNVFGSGWLFLNDIIGGEEGYAQFGALDPIIYEGVQPLAEAIASGEVGVGLFGAAGAIQPLIDNGAPLGFVVPEPAIGGGFWAGALGWADHPNAARLFMNWLLDPDGGQTVIAGEGLFLSPLPLSEFSNVTPEMKEIPESMTVFDGTLPEGYDEWRADVWEPNVG